MQVGGQRVARARDQQVAAELEVQRFELGVVALDRVGLDALVGGQCAACGRCRAEIDLHAIEQREVVLLVFGAQLVEAVRCGGRHLRGHARQRWIALELLRGIGDVARAGADDEGQRIAAGERQCVALHPHRAAFVQHADLAGVAHAVGQRACRGDAIAAQRELRSVHVGQAQRAAVLALPVGAHAHDDYFSRMAGKRLAVIRHAALRVGDAVHPPVDVQFAHVAIGGSVVVGQIDEDVAEGLIRPHDLVVTRPQRDVVELDVLALELAEEHRADAAVADGQRLALPALRGVRCGLEVAQGQVAGGCRADPRTGDARQQQGTPQHLHAPGLGRPTITPRPWGARYTVPCSSGSAVIDNSRP